MSSSSSEDTDDAEEDDGDAARADAACDVVSESELSSEETMAVRTLRERFRFGRRIALSADPISVEIVENRILHARKTWEIKKKKLRINACMTVYTRVWSGTT